MNTQYGFLFNQKRCIGCNTCIVACKDWNNINPGAMRIRRFETHTSGKLPDYGSLGEGDKSTFKLYNMIKACYHCEDPKCVKACGSGAISKDEETGVVLIDQKKCIGLRTCEGLSGCPYGNITHVENGSDQETVREKGWQIDHPAHKCNLCRDRLAENKPPICVSSCLTRALDFGPMDELKRKYPEATQENVTGFSNEGTNPNWLFIKK